jgi:beta-lactamase superfamily II metal-dependent hydrolase
MGHEIDFIAVGDGERGGDAIAVRWGDLNGKRSDYKIIVIDGGTKESGADLVKHINNYYNTNEVNLVFCSHPDADHASGLTEVLENMVVGGLVIHRPWEHVSEIKQLFKNGKITGSGLEKNLIKALEDAFELESIAQRKKIPIYEPFSDNFTDPNEEMIVLSPSQDYYNILVANFRKTPQPKDDVNIFSEALSSIQKGVKEAINWVQEHWGLETLADPEDDETSAENNSSVVLLLNINGQKLLFTGDAGVPALKAAVDKAASLGINLKEVEFIQVPHHGSKHNVGPLILDMLVGPKLEKVSDNKTAFISAPKEGDPKHPSRKVVNAFIRRGAKVIATQGSSKRHHKNAPIREGWIAAQPLSFYDKVAE